MGVLGMYNIQNLREGNENLTQGVQLVRYLDTIRSDLFNSIIYIQNKILENNFNRAEVLDNIQKINGSINENWNEYAKKEPMFDQDLLIKQHGVRETTQSLIKNFDLLTAKLQTEMQNQDFDIAKLKIISTREFFPLVNKVINQLDQLLILHKTDTDRDVYNVRQLSDWLISLSIIWLIISLIILIAITLIIIKGIVKPLEYAVENVDQISVGNIPNELQISSGGELGHLLDAMHKMIASTKTMCISFAAIASGDLTTEAKPRSEKDILGISLNDMLIQMRSMIGEIQDEVNSLTSTSQEILSSLAQLSTGATETASAVTETTTTIEELKQTAHVSADKAKDVLAYAEETLQTVTSSGSSVAATIDDMNQIRDRMQVISDSILKLSEKGLAIAGFMDAVSEIAEQSNLLAVNAALEAAKAGEQGRSFSIVAQQIRILAEQSKGATIQVRSLLSEIQNATNAAVLATDQGAKAVAKGVDQSTNASRAMMELAQKMERFTQAASQIVHSNQQQLIGTEQITIAMSNINDATNQHVEQLKQIETALESLNRVSSNLKELISQYKLVQGSKDLLSKSKEKRSTLLNIR